MNMDRMSTIANVILALAGVSIWLTLSGDKTQISLSMLMAISK
jgi:hypothetical protein